MTTEQTRPQPLNPDELEHIDRYWRAALYPIPPALWLFSSGFLGIIGIARRKKAD